MPDADVDERPGRLQQVRTLTRAGDWWHHKVPVVLTFAYAVLLGPGSEPVIGVGRSTVALLALLASIVGVAGIGHVVNDLADAEQDRRAGRLRPAAGLDGARRARLLLVLAALALLPWLVLPARGWTWALLALELALLVGYSTPPVRAKERGVLALVFDASYAFVVPIALTVVALAGEPVGDTGDLATVLGAALVWSMLAGLRGIAFHQIDDVEADRLGGAHTWATALGPDRALRRITPVVLAEPVAFAAVAVTLAGRLPLLPWWLLLVVAWRSFQLRFLEGYEPSIAHLDREQRLRRLGFGILNEVYERWLPIIVVGTLVVRAPEFWPLLIAHTVVFDNGLVGFVERDLVALPSFRYTRAYWSTYWTGRLRGSRARTAGVLRSSGRPLPAGTGRWVFVVCGPKEHVETLHTALRWLGPRTNQEIVVVTDSRRNELAVEHDRVIDVVTPNDLDDRQASIWLKTSLHRHVPLDVPACYLDTDVIAVRGDVDDVFGQFVPPVTFASDRMIRENDVDRFSPAAMTCADTGRGETSSCHHLREALADKWGLHPPADWLHWNGGVFVFDASAGPFLDEWHDRALQAFADARFQSRDQHALIATVWARGLQDQPRLPVEFNTIVDLGNTDVTWRGGTRFGVHPDERPPEARLLHLWCNDLHDPTFDLRTDVEEVVLRRMARRAADNVRDVGSEVRDAATLLGHGVRGAVLGSWWMVRRAVGRGASAVVAGALAVRYGLPRLYWRLMFRFVYPVLDVVRRAGRSVARRVRIFVGRETSPGGRLDALRFPKGWRDRPTSSGEVEAYYDEWHERYVAGFGDVLQTFRSRDPATFLVELGERAGLASGQRVLDAGCGVGGPAMLYAERFGVQVDAVTLSQAQVDDARRRVAARGLADRVTVHKGDFHRLEDLFDAGTFDVVYFLEAFCHSDHPRTVLESVRTVLRPGGAVFIKDLFRNRGASPEEEADIEVAVRNTERHCHLNVWPRDVVLDALRATGFEIELDEPFPLFPDFDYDTGNDFVNDNGIDIFEGRPSTYLEHAAIRARKPAP